MEGHPAVELEVFAASKMAMSVSALRATGEDLGSFARAWTIPLGFHPFSFSLGTHTPRKLRKESWCNVKPGRSLWRNSARAILPVSRAISSWPSNACGRPDNCRGMSIFAPPNRPCAAAGAEGRDKDTKPVYIDFESYLFLEIFHRWLTKAGELEITEMLPTPDQFLWREPDGRQTFELRTQIIPR